ncbi:MAG: hypothetical protein ACI92O_000365 [Colwellia sp.]|jgi:hypothetical protein
MDFKRISMLLLLALLVVLISVLYEWTSLNFVIAVKSIKLYVGLFCMVVVSAMMGFILAVLLTGHRD